MSRSELEEEEVKRIRRIEELTARARKLIAYKYTFFGRRTYLVGRIDEKLDRIADALAYYGIDGRRLIKEMEEQRREKRGWR